MEFGECQSIRLLKLSATAVRRIVRIENRSVSQSGC